MGQHKTNPTAIKATKGEITPKQSKPSKAERDRLLYAICNKLISCPFMGSIEEAEIKSKNNKGE